MIAQQYEQREYDEAYWAEYEARQQREIEEKIALMELEKNKEAGGEKGSEAANSAGIPLPLLYEVYEDSGGSELRRINDKGLAPERTGTSGKFFEPG